MGLNTIFGGGIGAFTKAGTHGLSKTIQLIQESNLPTATADTIGKLYAKIMPLTRGLDEYTSKEVGGLISSRTGREWAETAMTNRELYEAQAIKAVSDLKSIGDDAKDMYVKARQAARTGLDEVIKTNNQKKVLYTISKTVNNDFEKVLKKMEADPVLYETSAVDVLRNYQAKMVNELKTATTKGEYHEVVEKYRILIDEEAKWSEMTMTPKVKRTVSNIKEIRKGLSEHLSDTDFYGDFGNVYKDINKSATKYYDAYDELLKNFGKKTSVNEYTIDANKVVNAFRNPDAIKSSEKLLSLSNFDDAIKSLEASASKTGKVNPEASQAMLETLEKAKATLIKVKEARTTAVLLNALEVRTGKTMMGTMMGGAAGTIFGGPVGALAGGVIGGLMSTPASMIKILTKLESLGIAGSEKGKNAIAGFLNRPTIKATSKLTEEWAPRVTLASVANLLVDDNRYEKKQPTLKEFRDLIDQNIQQRTIQPIMKYAQANPLVEEFAPGYAAASYNTVQRALEFLQRKMPRALENSLNPFDEVRVSKSREQQFKTYVDAAFNPGRIYQELKEHRPNPDVVEAVQIVYPALFSNLQKEIFNQATEGKLNYKQKLTLGNLFGIKTMPAMSYIQNFQDNYIREENAARKMAMTKNTITALAKSEMTTTDKLQN
jgi:hypothetical protein